MATSSTGQKRILALDIMRGITIAGMILVNNAGASEKFAPLGHASWNGLTPTDLVFPFFMFIMGISTYISLRKFDFRPDSATIVKILRRTVTIFAIGLAIAWFGLFTKALLRDSATLSEAICTFDHIRILGVLQRLAISYGAGALIAITVRHSRLPWLIAATLIIYSLLLILGNGYEEGPDNIISRIDRAVLGENHMYHPDFDPEGLLSTLPSIAHMLIGFCCARIFMKAKSMNERMLPLFIVGTVLTFSGLLFSYGLPINKKVWSPTFVLTTCGMASSLLALLIWIIDVKGWKRWCTFFHVFGINPLYLYVQAALLSIMLGRITVTCGGNTMSLKGCFFENVLMAMCPDRYVSSLIYAILFVLLNWMVGYILYKKKIYIKI